ncbi:unnamed protein product [Clonostachys chloroleuca]|uniref:Peptidase S1 domain-containing protein n=1 Tax=Clonostachys chloroleuca TaxID=1926264 RepID=A0AA35PY01_9HYPO|nr:unnamed protein product [Clonostachys chloroleuca]
MARQMSLKAALLVPLAGMAAAAPAAAPADVGINIVGGTTASSGEFPYIVSLSSGGSHFCGGVLLNANTVVTAGHCSDSSASSVRVRAGSLNRSSGGTQVGVSSITIHPDYYVSNDIPYNDIAVWKLSTSIAETSSTIKYAKLAAQGSDPSAGTTMTVAGWGLTSETGTTLPTTLRKVSVPVVSRSSCQADYGSGAITDAMWCAGFTSGGKDSCSGDSGGPIVDSSGTLTGVVSWGNGCAQADYPGVYTRIGKFNTWINSLA